MNETMTDTMVGNVLFTLTLLGLIGIFVSVLTHEYKLAHKTDKLKNGPDAKEKLCVDFIRWVTIEHDYKDPIGWIHIQTGEWIAEEELYKQYKENHGL